MNKESKENKEEVRALANELGLSLSEKQLDKVVAGIKGWDKPADEVN